MKPNNIGKPIRVFTKRFGFNENFTLRIQYNSGAERRLNLK